MINKCANATLSKFAISLLVLLLSGTAFAGECVILLHGLARTSSSMNTMQEALLEEGFSTANIDYPSREHTIEYLATTVVEEGLERCRKNTQITRIHFVTHSLGGILVRQYLSKHSIDELGRVVMLGPPNKGSAAADEFGDLPGYDWINGPAGRQMGKGEGSIPLRLGPVDFELGVIAGNRTVDPITSAILENPDDGKVSVEDTRIEGMADFVVVAHSHAFMMRMRRPIELTIRFLRTGSFTERGE